MSADRRMDRRCGRGPARGAVAVGIAGAIGSAASLRLGRALPPALRESWARINHAGRPITLLEGPAWTLGVLAGHLVLEAMRSTRDRRTAGTPTRSVAALPVVAASTAALGALDDLMGSSTSKGLGGHLGALRRGEVTTGTLKVVGLVVVGVAGATLVDRSAHRAGILRTALGGAVIAGAANVVNLFDLRPGRALKVMVAAGSMLALGSGSSAAAAAVGASLGVIRDDLAARSMLGDTGANAAGAVIGLAVVEHSGVPGRALALAGLAALTLASERVSFSAVIEANPLLRRLDHWGREP